MQLRNGLLSGVVVLYAMQRDKCTFIIKLDCEFTIVCNMWAQIC